MGVGARVTDWEGGEEAMASRVLLVSLAVYALSFFSPALDDPQRGTFRGYAVFLMALCGPAIYSVAAVVALVRLELRALLILVSFLPWLANIAYWLAAYRLHIGRRRGVVTLSVLAVLLGLSSCVLLTLFWLAFPADRRGLPPVWAYREGYWLWLGSMALLAYGGWDSGGTRLGRNERATAG